MDTPVKRYSSGMYVRLAFAVAAYLEPEILFVDEVLSVGDQAFQQRCIGRMGEIARWRVDDCVRQPQPRVDIRSMRARCPAREGKIVRDGAVDEVVDHYVSSIEALAGHTLDDRRDREGNGRLRVTRVEVAQPDGSPARTGGEARVRLLYDCEVDAGSITASIAVEGPLGEPVFYGANALTGETIQSTAPDGELICELPGATPASRPIFVDVLHRGQRCPRRLGQARHVLRRL